MIDIPSLLVNLTSRHALEIFNVHVRLISQKGNNALKIIRTL